MQTLFYIFHQTFRFLTFRRLNIDSTKDINRLAVAGVIFAWLAGIGRYWDHPSAHIWQYMGLGSIAYVFCLSVLIWLIVLPIRPETWSYKSVLTFVGLTSPLAWLYAIPVETFLPLPLAIEINIKFLAIVALWRVALYVQFLRKVGRLSGGVICVITFLPLTGIIVGLMVFNLEHAVFEIMAGLEIERTGQELIHDSVYQFIILLSIFSMLLLPLLLMAYIAICVVHRKALRRDAVNKPFDKI